MNWHKHILRKLNIMIIIKNWKDTENSTKERVKGNRSSIYIVENWQETEQQKEHKQGQDEAQELTERE